MEDRLPPFNSDAEVAVLGAILLDNAAFDIVGDLSSSAFWHPKHRMIYEAFVEVALNRGEPLDVLTVSDELRRSGWREAQSPETVLADIAARVPTAANITFYAKIVRQCDSLRRMISGAGEVISAAYRRDGKKATEILETLEYRDDSQKTSRSRFLRSDALGKGSTMRMRSESSLARPIPTGLSDLDRAIKGLSRRRLCIVGGRPGAGKTTLTQVIADNLTGRGLSGGVISLEEEGFDWMEAQIGRTAGLDSMRVLAGELSFTEQRSWDQAAAEWSKRKLVLVEERGLSMRDICRRARTMKREDQIDFLVIDYQQQIRRPGRRKEHEEIAEQLGELLDLIQEIDVGCVLVSQLNRVGEQDKIAGARRRDHRPMIHQLQGAGALEQFAYQILLMHRECMYDSKADGNIAECIVGKAKRGKAGIVKMLWIPHLPSLRDLPADYVSPVKQKPTPKQGNLYENEADA